MVDVVDLMLNEMAVLNSKFIQLTTYTNSITGESFCFLSNNNQIEEATVVLEEGNIFVVPAWSVSILGGCNKEIFNTAKVETLFFHAYKSITVCLK